MVNAVGIWYRANQQIIIIAANGVRTWYTTRTIYHVNYERAGVHMQTHEAVSFLPKNNAYLPPPGPDLSNETAQ